MNNPVAKKAFGILWLLLLCVSAVSAQTTFYKAYYRVRFGMNFPVSNPSQCSKTNFNFTVTLKDASTRSFPKDFTLTPSSSSTAMTVIQDDIYLPWLPDKCNISVILPTFINQDIFYTGHTGNQYSGSYNNPNPAGVPNCQLFLYQAFPIVTEYECVITNPNPATSYCEGDVISLSVPEAPVSINWEISSNGINYFPFKQSAGGVNTLNFGYSDVLGSGISDPNGVLNLRATVDYGNGTVMHPLIYSGIHFEPPIPVPATIEPTPPNCAGEKGAFLVSGFKYANGSAYTGDAALTARFQEVTTLDVTTSSPFTTASYTLPLAPGTYQLKITKAGSDCTMDLGIVGTVPAAPPALGLSASASCNTGAPALTLTATGGTAPYSFSIDGVANPDGDNLFTGLAPATNYTLRVQDAKNCKATIPKTTQAAVTAVLAGKTDPTGPGAANGSIAVTAGGGAGAPYNYSLNKTTWQTANVFNGLQQGAYSIWVRDAVGCTNLVVLAVSLQDPQPVTVSALKTPISCNGLADGTATLTGAGGTPPFTYSADGITYLPVNTFSNLSAGNHTMWAKDSKGNTGSTIVNIFMPPALSISVANRQDVLCKGATSGQITVSATGGTGALQYRLSTAALQAQPSFTVPAGQYTVTVIDANSCLKSTAPVTISEPVLAVAVNPVVTAVNCNGEANGNIAINAANGALPYQYQLNGGAWQTSAVFNGLAAGIYTVNVKDNNSCPASQGGISVTQPPLLTMTLDGTADATCFNIANGSITVSTAGGSGNVRYYINTAPTVPNTTGTFNGLPAGSYTVTAKDEHNCTATVNAVIGQPALLEITPGTTPATCSGIANGKVTLQAKGGTAPYTYSLDGISFSSPAVFENLSAGNYTGWAKDAHGCIASVPLTVSQPPLLSFTAKAIDALCAGAATGVITITATGGTGAFTYSIDGGLFTSGNVRNNIAAGTRLVSVMDANGCVKSNNIFVGEPPALILQVADQQPASCFGGSNGALTVAAGGGKGPYLYAINGGVFQAAPVFSNLAAGTYTILVKDANNCTLSINTDVTQPAQLSLQVVNKTDILCAGAATGSMELQAMGGTAPYTYSMDGAPYRTSAVYTQLPADNYAVMVKDNNQCTRSFNVPLADLYAPLTAALDAKAPLTCDDKGSITVVNVQGGSSPYSYSLDNAFYGSSPVFNNLLNGEYTVYIKDVNGCAINRSIAPYGPVSLHGAVEAQPALCNAQNNGSIKVLNVTGGNNQYEYSIDGIRYQPAAEFNNLRAGVYQVHVRDVPYSCQIVLTAEVKEPMALSLQLVNNTPVNCFNGNNGALTVLAGGGTGSYAFALDNGTFNITPSFTGLAAGQHTIQVKDDHGCLASTPATITQPPLLTATVAASRDITCAGMGNGEITLRAAGGTSPYLYALNNGSYRSSPVFTQLQKGNYNLQIKDNNGCVQTVAGIIKEPEALQLQVTKATDVACFGTATGSIQVTATGGTGNYVFALNALPAKDNGSFNSLTAGAYLLSVHDGNACTARESVTLQQPAQLQLSKQVTQPGCSYLSDGRITITVTGGITPYDYNWDDPAFTGNVLKGLGGGTYNVTVTDARGCQLQENTLLVQPQAIAVDLGFTDTVLCIGQTLQLDAGNPGANYSWVSDAGFNNQERTVQLDKDGHYTLTVTNEDGCKGETSFNIYTSSSALVADFLISSYGVAGDTVVLVDVSKPTPAAHEWTLPDGARDAGSAAAGALRQLIFDQPGDYTIKMLVTLGECADVISKTITILPKGQGPVADSLLGYREKLIKQMTAYPNPTDGPFKVHISLSKAANVDLKLISFNTGNVVAVKALNGLDNYEIPFDAGQLPQGIYIIAAQVEKEYQVIRILKL